MSSLERPSLALITLALTMSGCGPGESAERFMLTDSAGVEVAVSTAPRWPTIELHEATLNIGVASGPQHLMFDRVAGVTRLPNGTLAVGNGGSNSIRVFTDGGDLLNEFGGTGEGPGEFTHLREVRMCEPNVITTFDYNWRHLLFELDGTYLQTQTISLPQGPGPYQLSCDASGGILSTGWGNAASASQPLGNYRTEAPLFSGPSVAGPFDSLGVFPGDDRIRIERGDRPHPFGRGTVLSHHPQGFVLGTADRYEFSVHDPLGDTLRLVRWVGPARALTSELIGRYLDAELESVDAAGHPAVRTAVAEMDMPDSIPGYSEITVDPTGVTWIKAFAPPGVEGTTWWGFLESGEWAWELRLEPGFEAVQFGVDEVVGVATDLLGVETIRGYRLSLPRDST